jgi:hypothetical protein
MCTLSAEEAGPKDPRLLENIGWNAAMAEDLVRI